MISLSLSFYVYLEKSFGKKTIAILIRIYIYIYICIYTYNIKSANRTTSYLRFADVRVDNMYTLRIDHAFPDLGETSGCKQVRMFYISPAPKSTNHQYIIQVDSYSIINRILSKIVIL